MLVRRGRRRGLVAVAAVCAGTVLTALAAAGCSGPGTAAGGTGGTEALAAVRAAADVLAEAGTSRTRTSVETDSGGTRVTIRGTGVFDYGRREGRLRVVLPGELVGGDTRRPIVELIVPGALYMKNRGAGVPEDKWVRVDTTSLPDGNLVTGGATDPLSAAELLRGARAVSFRGEERWDGRRVLHYRGTADLAVAAEKASPRSRGRLAAAAKGLARATVPFDAYVDDRGRLRKVRHRFFFPREVGGASARGGGEREVRVVSTTLMYDFGTPVEITMPAPEDIYRGRIALP